jgi:hypothetical protein
MAYITHMLPTNPIMPHKPKQNNCIKLVYNQNHRMKKEEEEEAERKEERGKEKEWSSPAS